MINNQFIRGEKTGAQNIVKEIKQYQKKWLRHVQSMDRNRLPRQDECTLVIVNVL